MNEPPQLGQLQTGDALLVIQSKTIFQAFVDGEELFIAMEYMEGGDLTDVVLTVLLIKYLLDSWD